MTRIRNTLPNFIYYLWIWEGLHISICQGFQVSNFITGFQGGAQTEGLNSLLGLLLGSVSTLWVVTSLHACFSFVGTAYSQIGITFYFQQSTDHEKRIECRGMEKLRTIANTRGLNLKEVLPNSIEGKSSNKNWN